MTDRVIVYPGAIPLETDLLSAQVGQMVGLGFALEAVLGNGTAAMGLACAPTSPASLSVTVGRGAITQYTVVDGSPFGDVAASSDPLLKIGVNRTPTTLTFVAPTSPGQSQAFLIQAQFSETDAVPVTLPYFNAANPLVSFSGPNNTGTTQYTQRIQRVLIQVKNGVPASTGSQTAPSADAGWVPLYVVTLANGATTVTSGNIALHPSAPFVDPLGTGRGIQAGRLIAVRYITSTGVYTPTPGTNSVEFHVTGGGGGGGGSANTGTGQISAGAGGGGGGYARSARITSGFAGTALTVGAAGAGGAPNSAGGNGGASSCGSFVSATGGTGGSVGPASSATNVPQGYGAPGSGVGGAVNANGGIGNYAIYTQPPTSGAGGSSFLGSGGAYVTGAANGANAVTPGSGGGGGAQSTASAAGAYGGSGAAGLIMVWEYT